MPATDQTVNSEESETGDLRSDGEIAESQSPPDAAETSTSASVGEKSSAVQAFYGLSHLGCTLFLALLAIVLIGTVGRGIAELLRAGPATDVVGSTLRGTSAPFFIWLVVIVLIAGLLTILGAARLTDRRQSTDS